MTSQTIINETLYIKTDSQRVKDAVQKGTLETLHDLRDELVIEVPVDTGHLQKHHFPESKLTDNGVHAWIKVGEAEYWKDVQYGNRYRGADPYITRALNNVNPVHTTAEYIQKYLKVLK